MNFIRRFVIAFFLPLLFGVSLAFALTGFMVKPERVDLVEENRVSGFFDAGNRPLARIIFNKNILVGPEQPEELKEGEGGERITALPYPSKKVSSRPLVPKKGVLVRESELPPESGDGLGDEPLAWRVMGIFNGEKPMLMIRRGTETVSVRPGDQVNGWTLTEISLEEAVWQSGKKEERVSFADSPVRPITSAEEKEPWKYRSKVDRTSY